MEPTKEGKETFDNAVTGAEKLEAMVKGIVRVELESAGIRDRASIANDLQEVRRSMLEGAAIFHRIDTDRLTLNNLLLRLEKETELARRNVAAACGALARIEQALR